VSNTPTQLAGAFTTSEPYATATALGVRMVEGRGFEPDADLVGQWLAVHAGKTPDEKALQKIRMNRHPWDGVTSAMTRRGCYELSKSIYPGKVVGVVRVDAIYGVGEITSPWVEGGSSDYLLTFDAAYVLSEPVEARGRRGIWSVDEELEREILEGLGK